MAALDSFPIFPRPVIFQAIVYLPYAVMQSDVNHDVDYQQVHHALDS